MLIRYILITDRADYTVLMQTKVGVVCRFTKDTNLFEHFVFFRIAICNYANGYKVYFPLWEIFKAK